jgi:thioredoxin reductase
MFDVIIIGGSYAGLAAALQLGRTRRRVLVVDSGRRRNRFAASSHGFLGQDGQTPQAIAAKGRAEVLAYPSVTWLEALVSETRRIGDEFLVRAGGDEHRSKRLILATGVVDELPMLPGLAERWGKSAFHCPYCHGYELGKGRLGVLASGPHAFHFASLISDWTEPGRTTLFGAGAGDLDAEQRGELRARGIQVEPALVTAVRGEAPAIEICLEPPRSAGSASLQDGRAIPLDGLFVASRTAIHSSFAEQLGCELEMGPVGAFYKTDAMKETTVPGVFACGDAALAVGSVSFAVGDGVRAGISAHQSLVFRRQAA